MPVMPVSRREARAAAPSDAAPRQALVVLRAGASVSSEQRQLAAARTLVLHVHDEPHAPPPEHVPAAPSHSSPESTTPSPQPGAAQIVRQVFGVVFELPAPASHSSGPIAGPLVQFAALHVTPSPHVAFLHVFRQRSVSTLLPSSHSSTPERTNPSPHAAFLQSVRHASALLAVAVVALFCRRIAEAVAADVRLAVVAACVFVGRVAVVARFGLARVLHAVPAFRERTGRAARVGQRIGVRAPSSHSSPSSTFPLPQFESWQSGPHVGGVGRVANLSGVHDRVAAARILAIRTARVRLRIRVRSSVVALLAQPRLHDAVAAELLAALAVAAVALGLVAVVADLRAGFGTGRAARRQCGAENSVAASGELARAQARIVLIRVAVVALLGAAARAGGA
jgi:hypothetical protein